MVLKQFKIQVNVKNNEFSKDLGCLIMQHAEDYHLSKNGMINSGIIATKLGLSGIPDIAERIIIERDLTLLEKLNVDIIYLNFHQQSLLK